MKLSQVCNTRWSKKSTRSAEAADAEEVAVEPEVAAEEVNNKVVKLKVVNDIGVPAIQIFQLDSG